MDSKPGTAPFSIPGLNEISILDLNSILFVSDFQHRVWILKQFSDCQHLSSDGSIGLWVILVLVRAMSSPTNLPES